MRWSHIVASIGVVAAAAFAVYDEGGNLLSLCKPFELYWYAAVATLVVLFLLHGSVLAAGALVILRYTGGKRGILWRALDVAIAIAVSVAVGFSMAIADPVLSLGYSNACQMVGACVEPGPLRSIQWALAKAADWPNTPVAVLMMNLFVLGSCFVQSIVQHEQAALLGLSR